MTNFEKVTASPDVLGEFLASLPVATGPWECFVPCCLYPLAPGFFNLSGKLFHCLSVAVT